MKESLRSCFTNYFQNNLNDLKSTWKGIKKLISLKELSNIALSNIFFIMAKFNSTTRDSQCF